MTRENQEGSNNIMQAFRRQTPSIVQFCLGLLAPFQDQTDSQTGRDGGPASIAAA